MTPFRVIGIDPSLSRTGVSTRREGCRSVTCKDDNGIDRVIWIAEEAIDPIPAGLAPHLVVIEAPVVHGAGRGSMLQNWYLHGYLRIKAVQRGWDTIDCAATSLKKFATGSGKAKKPEMLEAARLIDPAVANDDEADALFLRLWGEQQVRENPEIFFGPHCGDVEVEFL